MKKIDMFQKNFICLLVLSLLFCVISSCGGNDKPAEVPPSESETENETEVKITPIITGVKEQITVYSDDPAKTVGSMLLDGVYTVEGHPCKIKFDIYSVDGTKIETLSAGQYSVVYSCDREDVVPVKSILIVKPADTTPPVIAGVKDKIVYIGSTISYRDGITVTDNDDENVTLQLDASMVDLTRLGTYPLLYSAVDKRGNSSSVSASVMVISSPDEHQGQATQICTKEELDNLCKNILNQIINDNMSDYEKANAIYNRVRQIRYIGSSNKDNWISGAYIGLTTGRGDCFNYFAASKALLTLAGIPNYDLQRKGGDQPHYWQIVYVDGGWYHFDACPTLDVYPIRCFLYTEEEVAAYTKAIALDCPEYYVYDYDNCPYEVIKSRNS